LLVPIQRERQSAASVPSPRPPPGTSALQSRVRFLRVPLARSAAIPSLVAIPPQLSPQSFSQCTTGHRLPQPRRFGPGAGHVDGNSSAVGGFIFFRRRTPGLLLITRRFLAITTVSAGRCGVRFLSRTIGQYLQTRRRASATTTGKAVERAALSLICYNPAQHRTATHAVNNQRVVPVEGIEPTLLAEHDFESCASTSSATPACS